MSDQKDIVIVGAARTPVGAYLGGLKTVPAAELGRIALEEAIKRAGVEKEDINEVIVGHVDGAQTANNLGRIIGINAGLPQISTGFTVNRICGSGFQSAVSACHELLLMDNVKFVAAGGVETLSRTPYYLPIEARYQGLRMGNKEIIDANDEGHRTASGAPNKDIWHMGVTAEIVAEKYNITREEQDQFAYDSEMKVKAAQESGRLAEEIIPVEVPGRKGAITVVDKDEQPRNDTTLESLAKLKPVFKKDGGTVTAGNASGLNDGGAFEIITTRQTAEERGLNVMAKIVDYSILGTDPRTMGLGPVLPIKTLLESNGLTLDTLDMLEINEAFAAQTLGCMRELGIEFGTERYARLNPNGGAVSIGHPLGMSGARILTSICYEFKLHPEKRYAIGSACIGGGQGIAILLENPNYAG